MAGNGRIISTREAAARLGVTPRQIQRYVRLGYLQGEAFGEHSTAPLMIQSESIDRFLNYRADHPAKFRPRAREDQA